MKRKSKQNRPVAPIDNGLRHLASLMIHRVTDMRDGTFRPEVVLRDDIHFGTPVASAEAARRLAVAACEKGVRAALEALTAA
jgi:hypothetical protein